MKSAFGERPPSDYLVHPYHWNGGNALVTQSSCYTVHLLLDETAMKHLVLLCGTLLMCAAGLSAIAQDRQYTYAWMFAEDASMRPRGGTTKGPPVTLRRDPSPAWIALQKQGLSKLERDRRAIMAMAGPYRTSFDFIETIGFTELYSTKSPYQSWGTEYVYLIEEEDKFLSLQHIIVMFIILKNGSVSGPMVVKHWRHDWTYEDRDLHVYAGHNRWIHERRSKREVKGTWSQAVYQVDDSPRYEAIGTWVHDGNHSTWLSAETWRPLPRREFSQRDDYHVLIGTNRHTITPTGWIQEEDNLKVVLDENGTWVKNYPVLAREAGLNRYELIVGHDFSAGDAYWEQTGIYWQQVRAAWRDIYRTNDTFTLRSSVEGQRLFMRMFEQAEATTQGGVFDSEGARQNIVATLERYLVNNATRTQ